MSYEEVELKRDCEVVQIPNGIKVTIPAGTPAVITQNLGDSYTIQAPTLGGLYRLAGKDADAIGKALARSGESEAAVDPNAPVDEELIWAQLRNVYDPEIPVNIVDLGLIYDMRLTPQTDGSNRVDVKMTLTAQGCGMGGAIAADAREKLLSLPGVSDADVQVVWDPPWTPQMISPEGKERLGMA